MQGTQHPIRVESLSNSGDGIGRIDGKVVFIPFACPGDELIVKITQDKKTFFKAKICEIVKPSPHRIQPPCEAFGRCGGCDWQHIAYDQQLLWKKKNLYDVLQKIGGLKDFSILNDVVESKETYNYRNRIQLHQNDNSYFYYAKGSHTPVPITQCLIADNKINTFLQKRSPIKKQGKIELAVQAGEVKVYPMSPSGQSSLGFRQVNSAQNEILITKTLEAITTHSIKKVLDLYCGQGNWSIAINKNRPHVQCIGVDIDPINIEGAKKYENTSLHFILGAAESVFSDKNLQTDLVILDPPRAGCDLDLLKKIKQSGARWINYISCHPATLARDLKELTNRGWVVEKILPIDMFPQTAHLETWCLLRSDS